MYKTKSSSLFKHFDFILLDCICLEVAIYFAFCMRNGFSNLFVDATFRELFYVLFIVDILVIVFLDTMKGVVKRGVYKELVATTWQSLGLFLGTSAYLFSTKSGADYSRIAIYVGIVLYALLSYLTRIVWKEIVKRSLRNSNTNALLIIANKNSASGIISEVRNNNYGQHKIVGLIVGDAKLVGSEISEVPVVGVYENIVDYVLKNWVDEVLICVEDGVNFPSDIIEELTSMGVTVHLNLEKSGKRVGVKQTIGNIGGLLVLTSAMNYVSPRQYVIKRVMDIVGGIIGCIITGILCLFLAPLIKRESPGPLFFTQERVGRNGKIFKIYKFRSMYMDAEERKKELMAQNKINDERMFKMDFDPRIIGNKIDENGNKHTGIGQKIRDWSIDEFPQFFNVLKGEMSLVGTRPPLVSEVEKYEAHHKARLGAMPGITGLWQVSGRSNILDFEEVVRLDTQYINNWSVGLDVKILCKTIMVVLKKEGSM